MVHWPHNFNVFWMCNRHPQSNYQFPTNLWFYIKWRHSQRSTKTRLDTVPNYITAVLFPTSPAWNEGQMVVSDCSRDANWWRLTQGSPILFYQSPWRQPVPSGSKFATQRKRLFKERRVWLIVLFLSGSPCSLESPWTKQPERKCTECNEAGASFLSFSLLLSLFVSATVAQTDISFLLHNKGLCQHTACSPGSSSPASPCCLKTTFRNAAHTAPHHSVSSLLLHPSPFTAQIITRVFSTSGSCISLSWLTFCLRLAEAIYSSPSPDAFPVGPRREERKKEKRREERGSWREEGAAG